MEMKKINSGELRAIGYGAAWSFYRDNIEEEFAVKKVSGSASAGKNPLDELFGQK